MSWVGSRSGVGLRSITLSVQRKEADGKWIDIASGDLVSPGETVRLSVRNLPQFPGLFADLPQFRVTLDGVDKLTQRAASDWTGNAAWYDWAPQEEGIYQVSVNVSSNFFGGRESQQTSFEVSGKAPRPPGPRPFNWTLVAIGLAAAAGAVVFFTLRKK